MTDQTPPQCGRTFVHLPHPTTAGDCPGLDRLDPPLFPIDRAPLIIRLGEGNQQPEVLNPEVLDGRGYLVLPHEVEFISFPAYEPDDERPLNETLADLTSDPLRAWMLRFPGPTDLDPGTGPGWGDDSDVEAGRCCPWCRGALTEHNRQVHGAGYAMGERHATEQPAASADYFTAMGSRGERQPDPWASDGAGYDVRVLRAGIKAIAADALVREDYSTAAYAYSVLAGQPIAPPEATDPDPLGDGTDPEAVEDLLNAAARWGQAGVIRIARALFHADAWHVADAEPDEHPEPTPEPSWEAGETMYVVDQQGATYVFPTPGDQFAFAADEAARGAINLETWTCIAPRSMTAQEAADYACSHGPDRVDA